MLPAELHHLPDAVHRYARLDRARLVIKAAVQNSAVVSGLMPGHRFSFSSTVMRAAGNRSPSRKAAARPTIPPPTMITLREFTGRDYSVGGLRAQAARVSAVTADSP